MTAAEKAKELVEKFKDHVYCFMGSGMLTNTSDENVTTWNAKACSIIAVDEILDVLGDVGVYSFADPKVTAYWKSVKEEINKL